MLQGPPHSHDAARSMRLVSDAEATYRYHQTI